MNRHKHRKGAAMKYFAGLDVSLGETAICVVDETGRIVREVRAASEPQALIAALSELGLDLELLGLEAWRSAERRVGNECVSSCRYRWSADHKTKTINRIRQNTA